MNHPRRGSGRRRHRLGERRHPRRPGHRRAPRLGPHHGRDHLDLPEHPACRPTDLQHRHRAPCRTAGQRDRGAASTGRPTPARHRARHAGRSSRIPASASPSRRCASRQPRMRASSATSGSRSTPQPQQSGDYSLTRERSPRSGRRSSRSSSASAAWARGELARHRAGPAAVERARCLPARARRVPRETSAATPASGEAHVTIVHDNEMVRAMVTDSGVGFDLTHSAPSGSASRRASSTASARSAATRSCSPRRAPAPPSSWRHRDEPHPRGHHERRTPRRGRAAAPRTRREARERYRGSERRQARGLPSPRPVPGRCGRPPSPAPRSAPDTWARPPPSSPGSRPWRGSSSSSSAGPEFTNPWLPAAAWALYLIAAVGVGLSLLTYGERLKARRSCSSASSSAAS